MGEIKKIADCNCSMQIKQWTISLIDFYFRNSTKKKLNLNNISSTERNDNATMHYTSDTQPINMHDKMLYVPKPITCYRNAKKPKKKNKQTETLINITIYWTRTKINEVNEPIHLKQYLHIVPENTGRRYRTVDSDNCDNITLSRGPITPTKRKRRRKQKNRHRTASQRWWAC